MTVENLAKIKQVIQSTIHMSNTDISKHSRVSKDILQTYLLSLFQLLISQTAGISNYLGSE